MKEWKPIKYMNKEIAQGLYVGNVVKAKIYRAKGDYVFDANLRGIDIKEYPLFCNDKEEAMKKADLTLASIVRKKIEDLNKELAEFMMLDFELSEQADNSENKLGKDLFASDCLLPSIEWNDLIDAVRCNCSEVTECAVIDSFNEMLSISVEDAKYLVYHNTQEVIAAVMKQKEEAF